MIGTTNHSRPGGPMERLLRVGLLPLALVTLGAWAGAGAGGRIMLAPEEVAHERAPADNEIVPACGVHALDAVDAPRATLERAPSSAAPDPTDQRRRRGRSGNDSQYDRTIEALALERGDVVAEIGAGNGRFSLRFAEAVGPEGRVYANELGDDDVRRLRRRAEEEGLDNLIAVKGAVDDTNLDDGCCDAMMMRMVYHMLTDPEPMARSFYRALRPGGRLLILEGDPEPGSSNADGVPANRAGMGIDPQIVVDELAAVGFELVDHYESFPGVDYALLFHKSR